MRTKSELRQWAKGQRKEYVPPAGIDFPHFAGHPVLVSAQCVAGYLPLHDEISPLPIMRLCHGQGKVVAVSAWDDVARCYRFCRWSPDTLLEAGPKNISQPVEKHWMLASDFHLILVPGLVFGRNGERLGFGAGIYDRLLSAESNHAYRVGLAHDWQVVDAIPQEPHDVRMHAVLTPTQLLEF